jgi:aspartate racemase
MKIPGVLGGLGPQTTADYYLRVQELALERGVEVRPPMLTWSVPLSYKLEEESIFDGTGFDKIGAYLAEGAKRLELAGVSFVVMPCNSLHICQPQIKEKLTIPFISIIDETVQIVRKKSYSNVALLATEQTAARGLYTIPLETAGINVIKPDYNHQRTLNEMVVRLINGKQIADDKEVFHQILYSLQKQGAEIAILACTDFHILFDNKRTDMPYLDTMEVLAQATVREMYY